MKLKKKREAVELRKNGKSIRFIAQQLEVSKSSVSLWVRDLKLSEEAQSLIEQSYTNGQLASQAALKRRTAARLNEARSDAESIVRSLDITPAHSLVLCSILYCCEGTKHVNDTCLTFSNSDPGLIRLFLKTFRQSFDLNESKLKVRLHLHEYHDEPRQLKFWSETTKIPEEQFSKTYWKPHTSKRIKNDYPGCAHVSYHDVKVSRKLQAVARALIAHN